MDAPAAGGPFPHAHPGSSQGVPIHASFICVPGCWRPDGSRGTLGLGRSQGICGVGPRCPPWHTVPPAAVSSPRPAPHCGVTATEHRRPGQETGRPSWPGCRSQGPGLSPGHHCHLPVGSGGPAALHGLPDAGGPSDPEAGRLHRAAAQRGGERGNGGCWVCQSLRRAPRPSRVPPLPGAPPPPCALGSGAERGPAPPPRSASLPPAHRPASSIPSAGTAPCTSR